MQAMTRLHTLDAKLADAILAAKGPRLRAYVKKTTELALEAAELEPSVARLIAAATEGRPPLDALTQKRVEDLQAELDDKYLSLQDALGDGEQLSKEGNEAFRRARAILGLLYACNYANADSVTEAVYETVMAYDNDPAIIGAIAEAPASS